MKKSVILEALKSVKIDNSPKNVQRLDKKVLIKGLKDAAPKSDEKGSYLSQVYKNINNNLAKPDPKGITFESEWRPHGTSAKDLSRRILIEAEIENGRPNAFRLNLMPISLDNTHAKFQATRGEKTAIVELLYPNANNKITLKVQVDGAEDKLLEIGLEDPEYLENLGAYIIKIIDESVAESQEGQQEDTDGFLYGKGGVRTDEPAPSAAMSKGTHSPIWEAVRDSDTQKMEKLMAIVEQGPEEDDEEPEDDPFAKVGEDDAAGDVEGSDVEGSGAEGKGEGDFGEDDFAIDAGASTEMGGFSSDFGGDFGEEGEGGKPEDVNSEDGIGMEDDITFVTFRDKSDWLNSSLDTMQKLVSASIAEKMQDGSGVIMTSDEILNGTVGIKSDSNYDIIDKFLKVYPELDNIDLREEHLEQIEDKLSLDDGQFDAWLQQKLPTFSGQEEVNETLNNEMFDDFEPMGGEEAPPEGGEGEGEFDNLVEKAMMPEEDEISTPEEKEAEMEITEKEGGELNEFPEVGTKEKPEEKPEEKKEEK